MNDGSLHQLSRSRYWIRTAVLCVGLCCALPALADQPHVHAKLACETLPQVVLCSVRLVLAARYDVRWADATITSAPAFLSPVKSKTTYRPSPTKLPVMHLGLTPNGRGKGELTVSIRAVACSVELENCSHYSEAVKTTVSVSGR